MPLKNERYVAVLRKVKLRAGTLGNELHPTTEIAFIDASKMLTFFGDDALKVFLDVAQWMGSIYKSITTDAWTQNINNTPGNGNKSNKNCVCYVSKLHSFSI